MADYSDIGGRTLGEVGHALSTEGLGVALGFLGAGFIGRQAQKYLKTDAEVTAAPTAQNYAMAWGGNNIPKIAGWYLLKKYDARTEMTEDIKKAFMGSVVFDTVMRVMNKGTNPASASIGGFDVLGGPGSIMTAGGNVNVQKLIQENTALRAELNKALSGRASGLYGLPDGSDARRRRFGSMITGADPIGLQTAPAVYQRQKKYGIMSDGGMADLTARFNML